MFFFDIYFGKANIVKAFFEFCRNFWAVPRIAKDSNEAYMTGGCSTPPLVLRDSALSNFWYLNHVCQEFVWPAAEWRHRFWLTQTQNINLLKGFKFPVFARIVCGGKYELNQQSASQSVAIKAGAFVEWKLLFVFKNRLWENNLSIFSIISRFFLTIGGCGLGSVPDVALSSTSPSLRRPFCIPYLATFRLVLVTTNIKRARFNSSQLSLLVMSVV